VEGLLVGAMDLGTGAELQEAAGVGGTDGFCAKEGRPRASPLTSTTALQGLRLIGSLDLLYFLARPGEDNLPRLQAAKNDNRPLSSNRLFFHVHALIFAGLFAPDNGRPVRRTQRTSLPAFVNLPSNDKFCLPLRVFSRNQDYGPRRLSVAVKIYLHKTGALRTMMLLKKSSPELSKILKPDHSCARIFS
jgi:hypothetical protein